MRSFSPHFFPRRIHSTAVVPLLCCTLVFLKGFGSDVLVGSAINRLLERTICRRYYQSHDHYVSLEEIDEKVCKLDPIQTELSLILGTAGFLSPLVELLVAIPLGIYADKWGRKSVLYCNILSGLLYYGWVVVVCFFDNKFKPFDVVACAVFYFIGGGPSIFTAMVLSIVADATPEGSRTTVFYHVQCIVQLVQVLAPLVGSILVTCGIWIPFYLGLSIQFAQFFVVPLLPYTNPETPKEILTTEESSLLTRAPLPNQRTLNDGHGIHNQSHSSIPPPPHPSRCIRIIALATFFVATLGRSIVGTLLQYVSLRYDWTLAQVGDLINSAC
ncbi:hypothetical protein K440DRAFT_550458 [Wilcoxina mikolae CBS 423.85]|nr:hypothetical protein K440DRAFT_550458 [Wilcoxina mikolae CBS 423.85]